MWGHEELVHLQSRLRPRYQVDALLKVQGTGVLAPRRPPGVSANNQFLPLPVSGAGYQGALASSLRTHLREVEPGHEAHLQMHRVWSGIGGWAGGTAGRARTEFRGRVAVGRWAL